MSWGENKEGLIFLIPKTTPTPSSTSLRVWSHSSIGLGSNNINSQHLVGATGCNVGLDDMPSCSRLRLVGKTDT